MNIYTKLSDAYTDILRCLEYNPSPEIKIYMYNILSFYHRFSIVNNGHGLVKMTVDDYSWPFLLYKDDVLLNGEIVWVPMLNHMCDVYNMLHVKFGKLYDWDNVLPEHFHIPIINVINLPDTFEEYIRSYVNKGPQSHIVFLGAKSEHIQFIVVDKNFTSNDLYDIYEEQDEKQYKALVIDSEYDIDKFYYLSPPHDLNMQKMLAIVDKKIVGSLNFIISKDELIIDKLAKNNSQEYNKFFLALNLFHAVVKHFIYDTKHEIKIINLGINNKDVGNYKHNLNPQLYLMYNIPYETGLKYATND